MSVPNLKTFSPYSPTGVANKKRKKRKKTRLMMMFNNKLIKKIETQCLLM